MLLTITRNSSNVLVRTSLKSCNKNFMAKKDFIKRVLDLVNSCHGDKAKINPF